jgi:hypothetical protein
VVLPAGKKHEMSSRMRMSRRLGYANETSELELARERVGMDLVETPGTLGGCVIGELALRDSHELKHGRLGG